MKTRNKKAFTVVELVIVIAIIAILAAILIPTFASLVKKANVSADTQLIRNLNTALASDSAANNNKPHPTMTDALKAAEDFGYDVGKINKSATDNEILWDSANDLFCYYDAATNKVKYIPESESKITKTLTADSCEYWCIISVEVAPENVDTPVSVDCGKEDMNWSVFLKDCNAKNINAKTGVDVGWINTVESINYERTNSDHPLEQLVKIRSYGGEVTVNAPNDTVEHYGFATELRCNDVKVGTFREFGIVGRLIYEDDNGKIEFGSTAVVYCYMNASDDENQNIDNVRASNGVAEGAIVYTTIANDVPNTVFGDDPNEDYRFKGTVYSGNGVVVKDHEVLIHECYNHNSDYDVIEIGDDKYVICKCCGGFTKYVPGENGEYVADNEHSSVKANTDTENPENPVNPFNVSTSDLSPSHKHTMEPVKGKEATCLEAGIVEHYHCTSCDGNYTTIDGTGRIDNVIIAPLGHDLVGTFCNRCGHPVAFIDIIDDYTPQDEVTFDGTPRMIPIYNIADILPMGGTLGSLYLDTAYSFKAFQDLDDQELDDTVKYLPEYDQEKQVFKLVESDNGNGYTEKEIHDFFGTWYCDYYVSFSDDVLAYTCGLGGVYGNWQGGAVGFLAPDLGDGKVPKNTEIPLLGYVTGNYDINGVSNLTYSEVTGFVQEFKCGFFNLSDKNTGTKFTVKLRMINPHNEFTNAFPYPLPDYIDVAEIVYEITNPSEANLKILSKFLADNNLSMPE